MAYPPFYSSFTPFSSTIPPPSPYSQSPPPSEYSAYFKQPTHPYSQFQTPPPSSPPLLYSQLQPPPYSSYYNNIHPYSQLTGEYSAIAPPKPPYPQYTQSFTTDSTGTITMDPQWKHVGSSVPFISQHSCDKPIAPPTIPAGSITYTHIHPPTFDLPCLDKAKSQLFTKSSVCVKLSNPSVSFITSQPRDTVSAPALPSLPPQQPDPSFARGESTRAPPPLHGNTYQTVMERVLTVTEPWGCDLIAEINPKSPPTTPSPPPKPPDPRFPTRPPSPCPQPSSSQLRALLLCGTDSTKRAPAPPEPPDRRFSTMLSPPFFSETTRSRPPPFIQKQVSMDQSCPFNAGSIRVHCSHPTVARHIPISHDPGPQGVGSQLSPVVTNSKLALDASAVYISSPLDVQRLTKAQSQPLSKSTIHVLPGVTNKTRPPSTRPHFHAFDLQVAIPHAHVQITPHIDQHLMLIFLMSIGKRQPWDPGGLLAMITPVKWYEFKQWDPGKFIQWSNFYNLEDKVGLDGVWNVRNNRTKE